MSGKNIVKRSRVSLTLNDDLDHPLAQVDYLGKTAIAEMVYPYGFSAQAPTDSIILQFSIMDDESNKAGIPSDPRNRFDKLKDGEVQVGNYVTRSSVKFDSTGRIIIDAKDDLDITVNGNVNLTCNDVKVDCNNVTVNCNNITANATAAAINAPTVSLDGGVTLGAGGGNGLARQGDTVQVSLSTGIGTITSGSSKHKADG